MANMEVILTHDVANLGKAGEIVRVKGGYGRNYLMPRGLALFASRGNRAQVEHHQRAIARDQAALRAQHEAAAAALANVSVSIARKAGEDGKLFGSVGGRDIAAALAEQNVNVDRRMITLVEPLRTIGAHDVEVRFTADIHATVKVHVVAL